MLDLFRQNPTLWPALVTGGVTFVAAVAAFFIGLINYIHNRRESSAGLHKEITESHNKLAEFQKTHPEVFRIGREWNSECMARVYSHGGSIDNNNEKYVHYYCYVEQCVNYCNLVLSHRKDIKKSSYLRHHRDNLVKQVITENYPIISNYLTEKKYLSPFVRDFVDEMTFPRESRIHRVQLLAKERFTCLPASWANRCGPWNFEIEHTKMCWPGGKPDA